MMQYKNQEIDFWTLLSSNSHGHPSFANCPNNALTHYLSNRVPLVLFSMGHFLSLPLTFMTRESLRITWRLFYRTACIGVCLKIPHG